MWSVTVYELEIEVHLVVLACAHRLLSDLYKDSYLILPLFVNVKDTSIFMLLSLIPCFSLSVPQ